MNADALLRLANTKQRMPGVELESFAKSGNATSYLALEVLDGDGGRRVLLESYSGIEKLSLLVVPPNWWLRVADNTRRMGAIDPGFQFPGTPFRLGDLFLLDPAGFRIVHEAPEVIAGVSCLTVTLEPVRSPTHPPARLAVSLAVGGPREGLPMLVRAFDMDRATELRSVTLDDWRSLGGAGGAWLAYEQVITATAAGVKWSATQRVTRAVTGGVTAQNFTVGRLRF